MTTITGRAVWPVPGRKTKMPSDVASDPGPASGVGSVIQYPPLVPLRMAVTTPWTPNTIWSSYEERCDAPWISQISLGGPSTMKLMDADPVRACASVIDAARVLLPGVVAGGDGRRPGEDVVGRRHVAAGRAVVGECLRGRAADRCQVGRDRQPRARRVRARRHRHGQPSGRTRQRRGRIRRSGSGRIGGAAAGAAAVALLRGMGEGDRELGGVVVQVDAPVGALGRRCVARCRGRAAPFEVGRRRAVADVVHDRSARQTGRRRRTTSRERSSGC